MTRGNIVKDPQTKQAKGYAFAHFGSEADMYKAIAIANGKVGRLWMNVDDQVDKVNVFIKY